jgi:hypothetical protein
MSSYIYHFAGFKCDEDIDEDDVFLNASMYIHAEDRIAANLIFKRSLSNLKLSVLFDRNINEDGSLKDTVDVGCLDSYKDTYYTIDLGD